MSLMMPQLQRDMQELVMTAAGNVDTNISEQALEGQT